MHEGGSARGLPCALLPLKVKVASPCDAFNIMVHPGYRKRTIFLLVAVLLVRFWFGQTFELSGQEAYLWLQGHGSNLSWSY